LRVGGVRGGYEGTQVIGGAPVVDGQGGHGDAVVEPEGGESVIGVLAAGDDAVPGGGEPEVFEGGAVLGGEEVGDVVDGRGLAEQGGSSCASCVGRSGPLPQPGVVDDEG
jgi:hypothetical protein